MSLRLWQRDTKELYFKSSILNLYLYDLQFYYKCIVKQIKRTFWKILRNAFDKNTRLVATSLPWQRWDTLIRRHTNKMLMLHIRKVEGVLLVARSSQRGSFRQWAWWYSNEKGFGKGLDLPLLKILNTIKLVIDLLAPIHKEV